MINAYMLMTWVAATHVKHDVICVQKKKKIPNNWVHKPLLSDKILITVAPTHH